MSDIRSIITDEPIPANIVTNMMRDEYVTCVGMNPSSLAAGLMGTDDVNPAAIKMAWEAPEETPRTIPQQDRMNRGTLAHLLILQPELLMQRVATWYGGKRIGKEWDAFEEANPGKLLITSKDYSAVSKATTAMRSLPKVAELLCGVEAEVALFGTVPCKLMDGHLLVKGQVDAISRTTKIIWDLKTTDSGIDKKSIERTVRTMRYREKMAMYRKLVADETGTEADLWKCFNVFMSMKEPYGVVIVKFVDGCLEWGWQRMSMALDSVEKCLAHDQWPMYFREDYLAMEEWECDGEEIDYDE